MKTSEQKESIRGKLQFYQEYLIKNEQEKRREAELDEDIEDEIQSKYTP